MTQNNQVFVLIRGLLRESRHWGDFIGILQKQFPEAQILTPEIPGNGHLHQQTSPNSVSGLTEAIRKQIPYCRQLNLIAISMGGMIAIDWMTRFPDEIDSAVIINTSARPLAPFYQRLRWQVYLRVIKMLFHCKAQQEQDILDLTSNRHRHDSDLLDSWQQWQQQYPVSAASARNQLRAVATFSITSKPQQPILIITSTADQLVDYSCSQKLQQAWQTDYQQHSSAGHDLPLDDPNWLTDIIKQWFNRR